MVSPYLMRPVRRLEDVMKWIDRAPGAPEASAGGEHAGTVAGALRPRVVWVNERLPKSWRKPRGGPGSGRGA